MLTEKEIRKLYGLGEEEAYQEFVDWHKDYYWHNTYINYSDAIEILRRSKGDSEKEDLELRINTWEHDKRNRRNTANEIEDCLQEVLDSYFSNLKKYSQVCDVRLPIIGDYAFFTDKDGNEYSVPHDRFSVDVKEYLFGKESLNIKKKNVEFVVLQAVEKLLDKKLQGVLDVAKKPVKVSYDGVLIRPQGDVVISLGIQKED